MQIVRERCRKSCGLCGGGNIKHNNNYKQKKERGNKEKWQLLAGKPSSDADDAFFSFIYLFSLVIQMVIIGARSRKDHQHKDSIVGQWCESTSSNS